MKGLQRKSEGEGLAWLCGAILLLLCTAASGQGAASPADRQKDVEALLALRNAVENWGAIHENYVSSGWDVPANPGTDACDWSFVNCSSEGRVIALNFAVPLEADEEDDTIYPAGTIPAELSGLSMLQSLTISNTNISGQLPEAWGNASYFNDLQYLDLSYNLLSGTLPASWGANGSFPALTRMNLSINFLSGSLPSVWGNTTGLSALQGLYLGQNVFSGPLPSTWNESSWLDLQRLDLSQNDLSGSLPASWGGTSTFISITSLLLNDNGLVAGLPQSWVTTGSFPVLKRLDVSGNLLNGTLQPWINPQGLSSLLTLNVSRNKLTGTLPAFTSGYTTLLSLNVSSNALTGTLPSTWGNVGIWQQLRALDLRGNRFQGSMPAAWAATAGAFPTLNFLSISDNNFTATLPESWANSSGLPALTTLTLAGNQMVGTLPSSWGQPGVFSSLRNLFLDRNQLNGTIPTSWGAPSSLPLLSILTLNNNNLSGTIPSNFGSRAGTTLWLLPGNEQMYGTIPTSPASVTVCQASLPCIISPQDLSCPCIGGANLTRLGSLAPAAAPPPLSNDFFVVLELYPLTAANVTQNLYPGLVAAFTAILPQGASASIVEVQDTTYSSTPLTQLGRRRLQERSPATRHLLASPHSNVQTNNAVNITYNTQLASLADAGLVLHNLIQAQESNSLLQGIQTTGGLPNVTDAQVMSINSAGFTEPPTPAAPKPANSLSTGGIIGVAVAVPVGACLIGAGVGLLVWRRNKNRLVARLSGQQSTASAKNRAGSYWNGTSPKLQTSGSSSEASQEPWEFNENGLVARMKGEELTLPWSDWEVKPEEIEIVKRADGTDWRLGQGGFGSVYKATWNKVTTVAVKVMGGQIEDHTSGENAARAMEDFKREVLILKACRDKHIVQFIGASLKEGHMMLVLEYMEFGDLFRALRQDGKDPSKARKFSWFRTLASGEKAPGGLARRVALDVARGLSFLHARKVVHFDLKSANILLSRDLTAKIADVGLAKILKNQYLSTLSGGVGTFAYAAPEVLLARECDQSVDIYSFGVVLWELSTLEAPTGRRLREVRPEECPPEVLQLMDNCLSEIPSERPTAVEIVQLLSDLS